MKIKERDWQDGALREDAIAELVGVATRCAEHIKAGENLLTLLGGRSPDMPGFDFGPTRVALAMLALAWLYDRVSGKPCSPDEFARVAREVGKGLFNWEMAARVEAADSKVTH